MQEDIYLSQEGYDKLIEELKFLESVKRREIAEEIARAREYGDLSENAEYDSAKEKQIINEKRIAEIKDILSHAKIIEDTKGNTYNVVIGCTVRLLDLDTNEEIAYKLVSSHEANYEENKISITSPLGQSLLGHKREDIVEVNVPMGIIRYKILEIL